MGDPPDRLAAVARGTWDGCSPRSGISHELDVWGHDVSHDWDWWRKQIAHHLPRFV